MIEKISNFYKQSLEIFKSEEDEQKTERRTTSREKAGSKKKSRKNISTKEIPVEKVEIKVCSRVLKEVELNLND